MYPISDLTAFCRKTTGDVPPKLVGASTTVVGSKMYLYGGRLVSERKMVSDIYMFDLETFRWERVAQSPEDDIPQARYFHSADTWRNHLIIFGGMAIKPQSDNPEDLCVLNDVRLFDLNTRRWLPAAPIPADSSLIPNARYAHLSSVTADRLFIIGGQDLANVWLDDVYIFDLISKTWIQRRDYPRHCGTYRSVAVTADQRVRLPQEEMRASPPSGRLGVPGARFQVDKKGTLAPNATQSESLLHLPYSAAPNDDYPCDIFLFSNYNFTDVQRELEVFTPLSDGDFTVSDRSASMTGTSFPPGLRFPTGAILGTFFIVAGTYLSQTYQSFSIWALDLINMTWSRIDPGSALASGSWFRSCLWASANKFVVFGNRHGNLVEDYNRRLLSWDHVTCIDLEAFGIYQPPPLVLDIPMQELGLAAFEEGLMSDFELICDDGRRIKCSRKLLEDRWPWFKDQRRLFLQAASRALEAMPAVASHTPSPDIPTANRNEPRPDPRLTARSFNLSEPYPITLAFLQYLYSMALITPLQHAPAVLSQLLLLSSTYQLTHLQSLVKHAMHRALSYATSVGIYGVSTLCSCRSLQIRALRVVMAYSQKRPTGNRAKDKDAGGSGGGRHSDAPGGGGGHGRLDPSSAARPRGMSDASYMRGPSEGGSNSRGFARGAGMSDSEEPMMTLSDMQEFGIPGQEVRIPSVSTNSKRMLPSLSEEPLVNPAARLPPPSAPLPTPPMQTLARMPSLEPLSPSTYGDRLTSRPYTPGSADCVDPSFRGITPARDRSMSGSMSPSRRPRPFSVMSSSTEQDILAIADILAPAVDASGDVEEPIPDAPPLPEFDAFDDFSVQGTDDESSVPRSVRESMSSLYHSYQRQSALMSSQRSSMYSDSDGASWLDTDNTNGHWAFHLPPPPPLDDTRSLSTSTSYSSLRTPISSRTASVAIVSPPISPTNSGQYRSDGYPPSPGSRFSNPEAYAKLLGTINETRRQPQVQHQYQHQHPHTEELGHARHGSEATEVLVISHESVARSDSRADTRSPPPGSVYSGIERAPAPAPSMATMQARRLPGDLQKLRIVTSSPSPPASAPAVDMPASSPFNHAQQQHQRMHRSAYPQLQASTSSAPHMDTVQPNLGVSVPPSLPLVPASPVMSSSSGGSSRHSLPAPPGKPALQIGKLFGFKSKEKEKEKGDHASKHTHSHHSDIVSKHSSSDRTSVHSGDSSELSRADEKRLKKEAARARTERLAQDLADKAKRRAEEAKVKRGGRVREGDAKPWEESGGLYEGISYF